MVGAPLRHHPPALLGPGGADDGEAAGPGQLDGGDADTAAGSVHEHRLAGLAVRPVEQRVERGGVRDVDRRALRVADAPRQLVDLGLLAERHLGVRAGERAAHVDAIALLDAGDRISDGLDHAGGVRARRVRKLRAAVVGVGAQVRVDGIHADGVVADEHLRGPRLRRGDLLQLQYRRAAVR